MAVGVALNADAAPPIPASGDEWLLLAPYGETAYWQQEKGAPKRYRQIFTRPQAETMAATFNSLKDAKGGRFRGLPVYAGHPDGDPARWPDESRLGGIMGLEARADGVYAQVAWNDRGEQNRQQGYLVYPSPAWLYDLKAARQNGIIAPDELRSVGLTNSPRIPDVHAWSNSDPHHSSTDTDPMIRKSLTRILGLKEDSTEEEIAAAVNTHFGPEGTVESLRATATNAEQAKGTAENTLSQVRADLSTEQGRVTTRTGERDTAQREAKSFRGVAMNALLDGAILAGKLSAAERAGFVTKFEANFDGAKSELERKTTALNTERLNLPRGGGQDLSTGKARTAAYNAKVGEIQATRKCDYPTAVAALRQDPDGKLILEAMEAADKAANQQQAA